MWKIILIIFAVIIFGPVVLYILGQVFSWIGYGFSWLGHILDWLGVTGLF